MRTRKYKKPRSPHRIFLVICEGETEEAYINLLKREYRLPITIKTKVVGNYINARLVSQYIKDLNATPEECSVFYVYDGDVESVKERIQSLEGCAVISTPCIELWFVLHHKEWKRPLTAEMSVKHLCSTDACWKSYLKGGFTPDQSQQLLSRKDIAIQRAKKLKWLSNPSSNMYDFIEALEREKKVK